MFLTLLYKIVFFKLFLRIKFSILSGLLRLVRSMNAWPFFFNTRFKLFKKNSLNLHPSSNPHLSILKQVGKGV